jgi:CheY-like chemotaxis protein
MDFGKQPVSRSDDEVKRDRELPSADAATPQHHTVRPTHPLRILVVDDNQVNLKVILSQLKRLGYSADVATDGLEALRAFETSRYDVVFMDCQMPNMDGYTATREIRRRYSQAVQIIAVTANTMDGDREKCLAAGMNDYLPKPVSIETLRLRLLACHPTPASV